MRLGIPLYGADPKHLSFGTKTGCRQLFARAGINHPLGFDNLTSIDEAISALGRMRTQRPTIAQAIVKLNEGVSGEGNATVDLSNLTDFTDADIAERVRGMQFELGTSSMSTRRSFATAAELSRNVSALAQMKCAAQACSYALRRSGKWNFFPPTIKCSAARAVKAISAAFSRPTPHTRARLHATRRRSRSYCETQVSLAVSQSISSSRARTKRLPGKPTPSRSICERAEQRILF